MLKYTLTTYHLDIEDINLHFVRVRCTVSKNLFFYLKILNLKLYRAIVKTNCVVYRKLCLI